MNTSRGHPQATGGHEDSQIKRTAEAAAFTLVRVTYGLVAQVFTPVGTARDGYFTK